MGQANRDGGSSLLKGVKGMERYKNILVDLNYIEKFYDEVSNQEPLYIFIRGHLYLESMMIQMIQKYFPCELKDTIFNFAHKVELISAMGYISSELKRGILKVNRVRNNLAHNIDMQLDDNVINDIMNSLPKNSKDKIIKNYEQSSISILTGIFFELFAKLVFHLDYPYIEYQTER
ncbi:hypothetical protein QM225_005417 (plasmid) [Bacillus cereus]|nr:hypothetical protein QM225_005417 [Bacillus cereus]